MDIVTDISKLREPTKTVEYGDNISEIVKTLFTEMDREREGMRVVGLAANQIGSRFRIFVMRYGDLPLICLVNPVITKKKGNTLSEEFCLSLPGQAVNVRRPELVRVKALNQYMKYVQFTFTGKDARIACHEIDHLDGKLIIDYE